MTRSYCVLDVALMRNEVEKLRPRSTSISFNISRMIAEVCIRSMDRQEGHSTWRIGSQ